MLVRGKKGTTESMTEGIGGMLIGVVVVIVLLFIGAIFWKLFFGTGDIDNTSFSSFERVTKGVLSVADLAGSSESIPFQMDGDYSLVLFNSFSDQTNMNCKSPEILRPGRNCDAACLCVCENEYDKNMCISTNAQCFALENLEFDSNCKVFEGEDKPRTIFISNSNNKISLRTN